MRLSLKGLKRIKAKCFEKRKPITDRNIVKKRLKEKDAMKNKSNRFRFYGFMLPGIIKTRRELTLLTL